MGRGEAREAEAPPPMDGRLAGGGRPIWAGPTGAGAGGGEEDAPPARPRDVGDVTAPREEPPPYCLE